MVPILLRDCAGRECHRRPGPADSCFVLAVGARYPWRHSVVADGFHSEDLVTRSSVQSPAYYVFDNTGGPGFVIVAGDDVAMPVLGYSFEHEFSKDNLPANLKAWLEYMRDEVNEARRSGAKAESAVTRAWSQVEVGTPVVELETAKWNQMEPYNLLCPIVGGESTYTGCTATAVAIVMRYHQWPEKE